MDTPYVAWPVPAGVTLQWSHDLSAMDTSHDPELVRRRCDAFNGAMTFQPWIHP